MKYFQIFIIFGIIGVALSSSCEPFLTLKCEANGAINFAAKAISRLSGLESSDIIDILNTTESEPFIEPLDCVAADLIALREQIWYIRDEMADAIAVKAEHLEAPVGICLGVLTRINAYIPNAMAMMSSKTAIIARESAAFSAIGMNDLYQEYLRSICYWDIIGSSMGAVLNADPNPAIAYIKGESTSLPYPFSCFKIMIDFLKNNFMEQLSGIFDGNLAMLTVPEMS
ncbi:unnamed protein product [Chironomus riparius]|uniref:Uncharacterized protein n=1 Tax=Chironomus riparius TaxID=315576 RepID=A0A9N9S6Q7_9DIPT|nr:unnamed protein product [Chironomus riparius]